MIDGDVCIDLTWKHHSNHRTFMCLKITASHGLMRMYVPDPECWDCSNEGTRREWIGHIVALCIDRGKDAPGAPAGAQFLQRLK